MVAPPVIYPGEEFYRNTGAVHWTVACNVVLNGVGKIRIGDAVWPIAEFVVAIILSVATMGMSSNLSGAMQVAAGAVEGAVTTAVMKLVQNSKWCNTFHPLIYVAYIDSNEAHHILCSLMHRKFSPDNGGSGTWSCLGSWNGRIGRIRKKVRINVRETYIYRHSRRIVIRISGNIC